MKKILLLIVLCVMTFVNANADDYNYLIMQKTDGTEVSFVSSGLQITFSGANLVAKQNGEMTQISLADLSKMLFSKTSTGINDINAGSTKVKIFTISGVNMGTYDNEKTAHDMLEKGIYIVKNNTRTYKITVR